MEQNKIIGLIGGLGPASTIDYYKQIIKKYRSIDEENYPSIIINSVNMAEILNYVEFKKYDALIEKLLKSIDQLAGAGAEIGAICSNTPHIVFNQIKKESSIPLISIVESAAEKAKNNGYKNVLLTGTIFTMDNDFYQKEFEKENIRCITPNKEDKQIIQDIIFPNLENGKVIEEDKLKFKNIVENIISKKTIDGVILGCTELPLMIKNNDLSKPILDTTEIHTDKIVKSIIT